MITSIRYAESIQRALLPGKERIREAFPESFVFYEPRDIVSGDFYAIQELDHYTILVAADCTGHGVPGGFLTMLCMAALKEILPQYQHSREIPTGDILNWLRDFIIQSLDEQVEEATNESRKINDGMDITLLAFDRDRKSLTYSISNHNLYICRNGEMTKIKGERMPVGRHPIHHEPFRTMATGIMPGDMLYLSSDGIQDQFGSPKNIKFTTKRLGEMVLAHSQMPVDEQLESISKIVHEWEEGYTRIDDQTLIGIRITGPQAKTAPAHRDRRPLMLRDNITLSRPEEQMLQSMRMAKRIQSAAFTPESHLHEIFPQSFIFTKAYNIVSGDFYKAADLEHFRIFVLADCSGCGIPGGFLSMYGIALLNEQLFYHYGDAGIDPAAMLSAMREQIINDLRSETLNDAINMTICAFGKESKTLRFAGAGQNIYICHGDQIRTVNGDKFPVGNYMGGIRPFSNHDVELASGDMVYITTDSLQSQFGGENGAKFSTKRMAQMFQDVAHDTIEIQRQTIGDTVNAWVEGYKQIDDLTVAGIRI